MRALIVFALIATAYSLCVFKGKHYKKNEKWTERENEDAFIYQCKKGKHGWKPEVVECIHDGKIKIPRGGVVLVGKNFWECDEFVDGKVHAYHVNLH